MAMNRTASCPLGSIVLDLIDGVTVVGQIDPMTQAENLQWQ
jgi:hypothetical protein